jgi:hypothetical protein
MHFARNYNNNKKNLKSQTLNILEEGRYSECTQKKKMIYTGKESYDIHETGDD